MTITEFLTARYDEDAALAEIVLNDPRARVYTIPEGYMLTTPDHLLADIAAKRAIVEIHDGARYSEWSEIARNDSTAHEAVVRLLAQPYAEHADFDPEWRVG